MHDIYPTTMELVLGSNWKANLEDPNSPLADDSMLAQLQQSACKFVSLDDTGPIDALLGRKPIPVKGNAKAMNLAEIKTREDFTSSLSAIEKCKIPIGREFGFEREETHGTQFKLKVTQLPDNINCSPEFQVGKSVFFYGNFFEIESIY